MKLNDRSLTPLYQQVLEDIKAQIVSGTYQPGDKLPSEAELSEMYSVSRVTVRRAIEELSGEGYLTSRQGKGTFVNRRKMTRKLRQTSEAMSFTDVCAAMGMEAGARVLAVRSMPAGNEGHLVFGQDCDQLINVVRVRTADGVPIMQEENFLSYDECPFLLEEDLTDVSLFQLLQERTGRSIVMSKSHTIEIASATVQLAKALEINTGDALFCERAVLYDQYDRPACMTVKYLVGTRYLFELG